MQRHVISVSSITYAIKGRDLLRKQGIKSYIEKRVDQHGNSGCGYVIIADGNRQKISNTLIGSGVKFSEIKSIA